MPKLVIGPPGDGLRDLFDHADEWTHARSHVQAILYSDHGLSTFSDAELQKWFAMMRSWNVKLELEVGAIKEWGPTADDTFKAETRGWDRFIRLGADLSSLAMDEPLTSARFLKKPDSYAVEETAKFVAMVRHRYPTIRIGDIEPYPSISLADHKAWLTALLAALHQQSVAPLDFYRLDVDWVSFTKAARGNWPEVGAVANATHAAGLPFSLIYWASDYPWAKSAGLAAEDTWYTEVLSQGYAVAGAGIHPDQYVMESWVNAPKQIVPDNTGFTFTRSVADFAQKFIQPATGPKPTH